VVAWLPPGGGWRRRALRIGYERAATGIPSHQPFLGRLRHGMARGHATDSELGTQVGVRGQALAGRSPEMRARKACSISR
jgi:hypothetical protein